jgi:uroporphyrinogen decarboxylase
VPNDRFLKACRRQPVDATPVWFMRQAGRYMEEYRELRKKHSILDLAHTPELAAEVTLQPIRAMDMDAAILFADILLPLEALGAGLTFEPGPRLAKPVRSAADVKKLPDIDVDETLGYVFKAIKLIRKELNGKVPLIGFAGAPFTLASYLIEGGPSKEFARTKTFMEDEPKAWDALMKKLRGITVEYLEGQVKAGAQALQLFDSWVGCLSASQFRRFVLPHSKWILDELKKTGVPTISFGTGTNGFLEDFASAGGDAVGVDWRIDLSSARKRIGAGRALQGNLDPVLLLGSRTALKKAVQEILAQAPEKGYIFNLGHGILPETPVDNVRAVIDWVHAHRS